MSYTHYTYYRLNTPFNGIWTIMAAPTQVTKIEQRDAVLSPSWSPSSSPSPSSSTSATQSAFELKPTT